VSRATQVVLGGEGLIGRALVRRLEAAGEPVVVHDLRSGFDLRVRDVPDPGADAFVWFLAWDSGGAGYLGDPARQDAILESNLALSDRVFGWLERTRLPFLFTTSQLAGAPHAYGRTKAMAGERTRALGGQVARLWNVYDAEQPGPRSHLVPDLVARAAATGVVRLATRGTERRQFIHAEDCAAGLVALRDLGAAEADLTSGEWLPVLAVAERLSRLLGLPIEAGDRDGFEMLVEPSRVLPGWSPGIGLDEGLARVIAEMVRRGWCRSPAP
jgi:nucleoside-diphosphate-sugar epimerase